MATGLRHAASSGPLKATLVRALTVFLFASAYWALLPLGSVFWGQLAQHSSVTTARVTAAAGSVAALVFTWRVRLGAAEHRELAPLPASTAAPSTLIDPPHTPTADSEEMTP